MAGTVYSKAQVDSLMGEISTRLLSWDRLVTGKTDGIEAVVADGVRLTYTYQGSTVYRFISTATDADGYPVTDAFYSDEAMTSLIVARG